MGAAISLFGLLGLVVGALSLSTSAPWLPPMKGAEAKLLIGGAMGALLVGGLLLTAPVDQREEPALSDDRAPEEAAGTGKLIETLRAYLRSNAPIEAAAVAEYDPSSGSGLIVRTTLFAGPENLAAGQRICEIARNVILPVQVEAVDGTELWRCDQTQSQGNPDLVAAALSTPSIEPSLTAGEDLPPDNDAGRVQSSRRPVSRNVAQAPVTAPAAAESGCHPNYPGECLPADAEDVDCAGGSGNGPHYAQSNNIEIAGADVFGLDADGDGYGCDLEDASVESAAGAERPDDPAPSEQICHPSYAGECLPADAEDVDCAGGSGNGPHYAQSRNIEIVGPDVFGLDNDDDGYGCDG